MDGLDSDVGELNAKDVTLEMRFLGLKPQAGLFEAEGGGVWLGIRRSGLKTVDLEGVSTLRCDTGREETLVSKRGGDLLLRLRALAPGDEGQGAGPVCRLISVLEDGDVPCRREETGGGELEARGWPGTSGSSSRPVSLPISITSAPEANVTVGDASDSSTFCSVVPEGVESAALSVAL